MNLERTPLLLERRGKRRATIHRAADLLRSRGGTRKRKKRSKLPTPFAALSREIDAPRVGMTMASAMGPVGVGGIMRHS